MDDTEEIIEGMDETGPATSTLSSLNASVEQTERQITFLQNRLRTLPAGSDDARKVSAEISARNRMLQNLYEERGELELKGETEPEEKTDESGGKDGYQY
jgi:hypothetical protein